MGKLIAFEFRKLVRRKSFYICFAIVLALIALSAAVNASIKDNPDIAITFTVASFTKRALGSSSFFLILGVFVALFCCDDISNNTLKNLYSRGYSRERVYFSKYIVSLAASVFAAALSFVFAYIVGKSNADAGESSDIAASVMSQLLIVVAYHAVFFSLATIIGKVGGSVAINIIGPTLVLTVLTLITSLLKLDNVNLGDYWLESAINGLTADVIKNKAFIKAVVMSVIYVAVFVPIGYIINKKKEL